MIAAWVALAACAEVEPPRLADTVSYGGPVEILVCEGAPVSLGEVRRAVAWWSRRCVVPEGIARVRAAKDAECPRLGPVIMAPPGRIYVLADPPPVPWAAGATSVLRAPWGTLGLIMLDPVIAARRRGRWSSSRIALVHELGHALAFDGDPFHGEAGSIMSEAIDTFGPDDSGVDLCPSIRANRRRSVFQ